MVDRGASVAFLAEAAKAANEPLHLFELQLDAGDGGTVWCSDCHRPITWSGHTYAANGHLLTFSGIQESAELRVKTCSVTLSGVDQTWIATVLAANYVDRPLLIYKGFVAAATDTLIVDPVAIFNGRVDGVSVEENPDDGTCTVTLAASDQFVDFERLPGRHTNALEQALHFASDTGFRYVSAITQQIKWGQA